MFAAIPRPLSGSPHINAFTIPTEGMWGKMKGKVKGAAGAVQGAVGVETEYNLKVHNDAAKLPNPKPIAP